MSAVGEFLTDARLVAAKDLHNVTYTCSVKKQARYHVVYALDVPKSKKRGNGS